MTNSTSVTTNDRLLRALRHLPVDRTPVWIMRQAGRYLPEYRATRRRAGNFLTLCKTPELATEVTLQPLARFPLDAAIVFSDILTLPDAMGLGLTVEEGLGPRFAHPVRDRAAVTALGLPDAEDDLGYVMATIRAVKTELHGRVPLIGFAGSPWTVATYMVEGSSDRDFKRAKQLLYGEPETLHALLQKVTTATIEYLRAQIAAGVDVLMVFDTWGGVLSASAYREFSLAYMAQICAALRAAVPVILFTKGGGLWLESLAATGCQGLGLDWSVDISRARERVGARCALQGNLDPAILRAPAARLREEVKALVTAYGRHPGHIFNLGHGITPDISPDNVAVMIETVHAASAALHVN